MSSVSGVSPETIFRMLSKRRSLSPGIDALRRVADVEIDLPFQARRLLQDGDAHVLCHAGIDGRLIDHDVAALEDRPIVVEALRRGSRSGCLLASIGVGTVTMWKSAARRSATASVNFSPGERRPAALLLPCDHCPWRVPTPCANRYRRPRPAPPIGQMSLRPAGPHSRGRRLICGDSLEANPSNPKRYPLYKSVQFALRTLLCCRHTK